MNHMASMVGPLAHAGSGMHSNLGMPEGMGIMQRGGALAEENGPSLGRAMGHVGEYEKVEMNHAGGGHAGHGSHGGQEMQNMPGMQHDHARPAPGYPQDMFMTMDEEVAKPETYGLREGWTGAMMGMMTLVRVLPPELYERIRSLQAQAQSKQS
jgi:manganese oxidase